MRNAILCHLPFLLLLLPQPIMLEEQSDECPRFCPDDLKATVFTPLFRERIDFLKNTLTQAIDGLEQLQGKAAKLPDHLKDQMGALFPDIEVDNTIEKLKPVLEDLVEHAVRSYQRSWNRVQDTNADVLDPSRAPKTPKTVDDLKQEVVALGENIKETEDSFSPLLKSLGTSLGQLLSPMMMLMEGMVKMGGEMGMEKLREQVDNLMGKVLLRMVINKLENKKEESPALFKELQKMITSLANDVSNVQCPYSLSNFWNEEMNRLMNVEGRQENEDEDILAGEDIAFLTGLVEKYLKPSNAYNHQL